MTSPPADRRMIGALLRIPFQATVRHISERLQAAGYTDLRPAHLVVFQQLDPEPAGLRLTELAERAQITKQSMGYLVDYLAARHYVERVADPTDGRASLVRMTARGRRMAGVASAALRQLEAEWAGELGEARMDELRRTLRELVALVERRPPAAGTRRD